MIQTTGRFLLTGAGFTHNFGAPLASDIWPRILSHPRVSAVPSLRERLLRSPELDFEAVYQEVLDGGTPEESSAIHDVLTEIFRSIDDNLRVPGGVSRAVDIYRVGHLIQAFAGSARCPGFVFTLNQDLFVERNYPRDPRAAVPVTPGVRFPWAQSSPMSGPYQDITVPNLEDLAESERAGLADRRLWYVKVHGSCNWRRSDGRDAMVVGRTKAQAIQAEPVLDWYFRIFTTCMLTPGARLLRIGYGFRDAHVNEVLAEAVSNASLQIRILGPEKPDALRERLCSLPQGDVIWNGVYGYDRADLAEVFPSDPFVEPPRTWENILSWLRA